MAVEQQASTQRPMVAEPTASARRPWRGSLADALRRTGVRLGVLGVLAVVLANLDLPWRPPTLCLLRQMTGVPCPLCGTTTAAVHVGNLDVVGALAANPFVLLFVGLVATSPLTAALRWWEEKLTNRSRVLVAVALLAAAEAWQLHRYGLLP